MPLKIGIKIYKSTIDKIIIGEKVIYTKRRAKALSFYGALASLSTSGAAIIVSNQLDSNVALLIRRYDVNFETYDSNYTHSTLNTKITSYSSSYQKGENGPVHFLPSKLGNFLVIPDGNKAWKIDNNYTYIDNTTPAFDTALATGHGHGITKDYSLYGGGDDGYRATNPCFAYDNSITRFVCSNLTTAVVDLVGGSAGEYALIGLGRDNNLQATVNVYDNNLTKKPDISASQGRVATRSVDDLKNKKTYFVGGGNRNYSTLYSNIDEFDENLTRQTFYMTTAKRAMSLSINDNILIITGGITSSGATSEIEYFDLDTKTEVIFSESYSSPRYSVASITLGKSTLLIGGTTNASNFANGYLSDVYTLEYE